MSKAGKATIVKRIFAGIWWSILLLLAFSIVHILVAKTKGKVPKLFGYSVMRIVSGSMEPELSTGSYILLKDTDPQSVQEGDVICFYSTDPQIFGMPNTHRVVTRIEDEQGLRFVTKGDANPANDEAEVWAENVVGVYVKELSAITAVANFMEGNAAIGVFLGVGVAAIGIAAYVFLRKGDRTDDEQ